MDEKILRNGTTASRFTFDDLREKICMETLSFLFFQLTNNEQMTSIPACQLS